MTKKQQAIELLDRIPEEKMDEILDVMEKAAVPKELNMENIVSFLKDNDEDEDMDEVCAALENMARAEILLRKSRNSK